MILSRLRGFDHAQMDRGASSLHLPRQGTFARSRTHVARCDAHPSGSIAATLTSGFQRAHSCILGGLVAGALFCHPVLAEDFTQLSAQSPLADAGRIVPSQRRAIVSQQLIDLERDTGWRVRILTIADRNYGDVRTARQLWQVDNRTMLIYFDTSNPNVFAYDYLGDDVILGPLRRPFWLELQSRYGNMFYVRENGEASSIRNVVDTVDDCLRKGGCQRVPGLPEEQYYFTLILSIAGGLVLGFASKLKSGDPNQSPFLWPLAFSPLWASLFINFGLGPIITRTDDKMPIVYNTAAFFITAAVFRPNPLFPPEKKEEPDL